MPRAAVPDYIGTDFNGASPALRFGMYLRLWEVQQGTWKRGDKTAALNSAARLTDLDRKIMTALLERQAVAAKPLQAQGRSICLEAKATAPFSTGLGNEHPLENGFSFLTPYGLPYLPGSGVKGVVRKAAGELADGLFGGTECWTSEAISALFGIAGDEEEQDLQQGALRFWDVIPQVDKGPLQVEIMTAHQSHYLQGDDSPHESGQPNPIPFLTVPSGAGFAFHVQCNLPFLEHVAPGLAEDNKWQALVQAALAHAFEWLGFGAKTAVGYGAMGEDLAGRQRREATEAERREARQAEEQARQREAEKAQMSPARKAMAEYYDARPDPNQPELNRLRHGLEHGAWDGDLRREIAIELKAMMEAAGKWKPTTKKKKPEKDADYQATLLIRRNLGDG